MQQHAKSIDRRAANLVPLHAKAGFEADCRPDQSTTASRLSPSSGTRISGFPSIPNEVVLTTSAALFQHVAGLDPFDHADALAKIIGQLFRPHPGPVRYQDLGNPGIGQRGNHGARCAACPQYRRRTCLGRPTGRPLPQVLDEPISIGVVGVDFPVPAKDQCIRRPRSVWPCQ